MNQFRTTLFLLTAGILLAAAGSVLGQTQEPGARLHDSVRDRLSVMALGSTRPNCSKPQAGAAA